MTDSLTPTKQDWYYQNHATGEQANTTMKLVITGHEQYNLVWVANRDIKKGEELCFNYHPGHNVRFS
jgi:SET domain-containing protein